MFSLDFCQGSYFSLLSILKVHILTRCFSFLNDSYHFKLLFAENELHHSIQKMAVQCGSILLFFTSSSVNCRLKHQQVRTRVYIYYDI